MTDDKHITAEECEERAEEIGSLPIKTEENLVRMGFKVAQWPVALCQAAARIRELEAENSQLWTDLARSVANELLSERVKITCDESVAKQVAELMDVDLKARYDRLKEAARGLVKVFRWDAPKELDDIGKLKAEAGAVLFAFAALEKELS